MSESAWTRARLRLDETEAKRDEGAVLRERTARLAVPLAVGGPEPGEAMLELTLGGLRALLAMRWVHSVHEVRPITRIPGRAGLLVGVTRVRDQILPVFDVGALVGDRPCRRAPVEARLVVLGDEQLELALLADSVAKTRFVPRSDVVSMVGPCTGFACAVGPAGEVILDGAALLADPRFDCTDHEVAG